MLRLTLEVVPFGSEIRKRIIGQMTISREAGSGMNDPCDYVVQVDDGNTVQMFKVLKHFYEDKAWRLVRRAIDQFIAGEGTRK